MRGNENKKKSSILYPHPGLLPEGEGADADKSTELTSNKARSLQLITGIQRNNMSHQSDLISTDIDAYLAQHERKELLRFLTCGNVDDGKSTLIGRLLHDSKMIYEDQLAAVQADSV